MAKTTLEHVNITVEDPQKTAEQLCTLFDWHIRWQGSAIGDGKSIHVGTDTDYIALYSPNKALTKNCENYGTRGGLNHIGIVVEDLDEIERRLAKAGIKTFSHADYEPGRRFYFHNADGIEFEVVSYNNV